MREILIERWYLGPILAVVGLVMCAYFEGEHADVAREAWHARSINSIYQMASNRDFKGIRESRLLDEASVSYLERQDALFGRVARWSQGSQYGTVAITVARDGLTSQESIVSLDDRTFSIVASGREVSEEPASAQTEAQALAVAKDFIHRHSSGGELKVLGLSAELRGSNWLVMEKVAVDGGFQRWYVIVCTTSHKVIRIRDRQTYWSRAEMGDFPGPYSVGR